MSTCLLHVNKNKMHDVFLICLFTYQQINWCFEVTTYLRQFFHFFYSSLSLYIVNLYQICLLNQELEIINKLTLNLETNTELVTQSTRLCERPYEIFNCSTCMVLIYTQNTPPFSLFFTLFAIIQLLNELYLKKIQENELI